MTSETKLATEQNSVEGISEVALWRAVILTALEDATGPDVAFKDAAGNPIDLDWKSNSRAQLRHDSRRWFLDDSADFRAVCDLANLDPDAVRRHAETAFKKGIRFGRAPNGSKQRVVVIGNR